MIRIATESDAESIIEIRKGIILSENTTKFFLSSPNNIPVDVNKEQEKINTSQSKGNLNIVFEVDDQVIGFLVFYRFEQERLRHAGTLGMGIKEEYCNQGIGTKLIQDLLKWATKQNGLEKICLGVVSVNERAMKLYKRMGFAEEGRQRNQIKYEDGTYADDLLMAYYLGDKISTRNGRN
ncbi:GNAT family N-acetyltransferase [Bacillus carboniphilus]|uniref:GNAT family N-acetyltransferase n=1 Tax=Bacillus carboniphilus TaxID=86663 RepID=A0ABY9JS34_9BACI|nr:GNAT family N-acetyltransferase [Bacillus carboniphilus]WLR42219.1 GNAT family N-acetyltransferase [Bacillus carboniphilus]